jgi:hypothetical protein
MVHGTKRVNELDCFIGRLSSQQADAQVQAGQSILFSRFEAGIHGIQHCPQSSMPGVPVGWLKMTSA